MRKDERDLLEVLKFELKFLESGGYQRSSRQPWRQAHIFEDSPTCFNYGQYDYDCRGNRSPCTDCVLIHLVPPESRMQTIPCRHIPLNESGDTLASLYGKGDARQVEEIVANWLRGTIEHLERERSRPPGSDRPTSDQRPMPGRVMHGVELYCKMHPKCANPACPTAFQWLAGGRFFRFTPEHDLASPQQSDFNAPTETDGEKHFWLCEKCSHIFTLVYDEKYGVVLTLLMPELPLVHSHEA